GIVLPKSHGWLEDVFGRYQAMKPADRRRRPPPDLAMFLCRSFPVFEPQASAPTQRRLPARLLRGLYRVRDLIKAIHPFGTNVQSRVRSMGQYRAIPSERMPLYSG